MNTLILNRDAFQMPEDGWYQVAPLGEFVHLASGVVQVVDEYACQAMAARFEEESAGERFPGLLIDFDHFSLDEGNRSEAAGWIVALEARCRDGFNHEKLREDKIIVGKIMGRGEGNCERVLGEGTSEGEEAGAGLWGRIRWSDVGEDET